MCCWSPDECEVPEAARRGGSGRKLQEPAGRFETRVKISDMRRCCMLVSCGKVSGVCDEDIDEDGRDRVGGTYELRVELGQSWLALAVEYQKGVDHIGRLCEKRCPHGGGQRLK